MGDAEQFIVMEQDGSMWAVCACGWEGPRRFASWSGPFTDGNAHVDTCTTTARFGIVTTDGHTVFTKPGHSAACEEGG